MARPTFVGLVADRLEETNILFPTLKDIQSLKNQDGPDACVWLTKSQEVLKGEILLYRTLDELKYFLLRCNPDARAWQNIDHNLTNVIHSTFERLIGNSDCQVVGEF